MTFGRRAPQLFRCPGLLFARIEELYILVYSLIGRIPIDACRAPVPRHDLSPCAHQKERIVLHPGGYGFLLDRICLVAQNEQVSHRQHVRFRNIFNFPRRSVRTQQL